MTTLSERNPLREIRWSKEYPDVASWAAPVEPCVSPEYFELERDRLFRRVWLYVGREDTVADPGDYFVKDLSVCRTSIIVVRGRDGELRAFHNVCRHRGNKLVWNDHGSCSSMQCTFHGWTYRLDGTLAGVPTEEQFLDFDKACGNLSPVALDVWQGLVFVHLDPSPDESLPEYLGELTTELAGYPFAAFGGRDSYTVTFNANWKVALDAFQEFYHTRFVHRNSAWETVNSAENPYSNALQIRLYSRHRTFSGYANPGYRPTPVEMAAFKAGMSVVGGISAGGAGRVKAAELPPGINPTRSATWSFDIYVVFPNLSMLLFEGMYIAYEFWPLAVDRTRFEINVYFPPYRNASERFSREHGKVELRDALLEDLSTLEQSQAVLGSGALSHFVLQDNELAVRHGHKVVEDYVGFYRGR